MTKNSKIEQDKGNESESGYTAKWWEDDDFRRRITPFFGDSR